MKQNCWDVWPDRGFLCNADPLDHLNDSGLDAHTITQIEALATELPNLLEGGTVQQVIDDFPVYDLSAAQHTDDFRNVERLMTLYSYFASAYVHYDIHNPAHRIPKGIAVPLHYLSTLVERPPILAYANYVLTNWQRVDANGKIVVDNLRLLQNFRDHRDESWFILIHVDIEARAAEALTGIQDAITAAKHVDSAAMETALRRIADSIDSMIRTFERMPEHCDPDVYYFKVRPYIFLFEDVVYEGVDEYGGKPMTFRGQTGAQSSIMPALVESLGLEHERSGLTEHLRIMRDYMPKPHREFIERVSTSAIRDFVTTNGSSAVKDAYNACLRNMLAFRKLHYSYATTYIAEKVENPLGTGGTVFMEWLDQLVDETEGQLV